MESKRDNEGYLVNHNEWSESLAEKIAMEEGIDLSPAHLEVVTLLRQFYLDFETSPNMRIFVNYMKQHLGEEKGNSIYLMSLFPDKPLKVAAKIAGLPKPTNCL